SSRGGIARPGLGKRAEVADRKPGVHFALRPQYLCPGRAGSATYAGSKNERRATFSRTRVSAASHPARLVRYGACKVAQPDRSSGPPLRRASNGAELSEPVGSRHTGGRYLAGYVDFEDAPEIGHRQGDAQAGRKSIRVQDSWRGLGRRGAYRWSRSPG